MYMYPCMYVCVCVCICIYMYVCACMRVYVYMCICICVCIYTSPYVVFAAGLHAFTSVVEHYAWAGVYVRQVL